MDIANINRADAYDGPEPDFPVILSGAPAARAEDVRGLLADLGVTADTAWVRVAIDSALRDVAPVDDALTSATVAGVTIQLRYRDRWTVYGVVPADTTAADHI